MKITQSLSTRYSESRSVTGDHDQMVFRSFQLDSSNHIFIRSLARPLTGVSMAEEARLSNCVWSIVRIERIIDPFLSANANHPQSISSSIAAPHRHPSPPITPSNTTSLRTNSSLNKAYPKPRTVIRTSRSDQYKAEQILVHTIRMLRFWMRF